MPGPWERREALVLKHMAEVVPPEARRFEREFRVPMEDSLWPMIFWIACCVIPPPTSGAFTNIVVPEEFEVRQVASYIDFVLDGFYGGGSYAQDVRSFSLPLASGHNTAIFVKRDDGWGYRRTTWETGSWPHAYRGRGDCPEGVLSLVEILDRVCRYGTDGVDPRWDQWKREHPDVFPA